MANECVQTRFNGVYQNDNIVRLNEFVINASSLRAGTTTANQRSLLFWNMAADGSTQVRCSNNIQFTVNGTSYSSYSGTSFTAVFPEGEYNIFIKPNNFKIGTFRSLRNSPSKFFSLDVSQLVGCSGYYELYEMFTHEELELNFNAVDNIYLSRWDSPESTAYLNIDNLSENNILTELRVSKPDSLIGDSNTHGSVANLKSPVLAQLHASGTKVSGDVKVLLQNMIDQGAQNGSTITIDGSDYMMFGSITFNTFRDSLQGSGYSVRFTFDSTTQDGYSYIRV